MNIVLKVKHKIQALITKITFSPTDYWENRAKKHGAHSVLNLNYSSEKMEEVTIFQKKLLFPLLEKKLNGSEKNLLDFGCGPGRFSVDLWELTKCDIIAVDPVSYLLKLAPKNENVLYKQLVSNKIPAPPNSFDIIWICLVLGGITSDNLLKKTIAELKRVANKNALLFLVENTSVKPDGLSWKYRLANEYMRLLKDFNLVYLDHYNELGEIISIFAGRINDQS